MKDFRETDDGHFLCKECNTLLHSKRIFNSHIIKKHNLQIEEYYIKRILNGNYATCKICGKKTEFYNTYRGFRDTCSKQCANEYRFNQIKKSNLEKYGSEIIINKKEIKEKGELTRLIKYGHKNPAHGTNREKVKNTMLERYGIENYPSCEKHKNNLRKIAKNRSKKEIQIIENKKIETCIQKYGTSYSLQNKDIRKKGNKTKLEKYGDENYHNVEQAEQTNLDKYGVKCTFQSKEIKSKIKQTKKEKYGDENYCNVKKIKQTCLERYGVEHPMQNDGIFNKTICTVTKHKLFKNTDIYYQSSYELDFLNKYYDKYPDITRGPKIKYNYKGKIHYYFPDFYIPSLKGKSTLNNGYQWILILNKNYIEFKNFINYYVTLE